MTLSVLETLEKIKNLPRIELKDYSNYVTVDGLWLEFGVSTGRTIKEIASTAPSQVQIYGFDCWEGLPEPWYEDENGKIRHPVGMYAHPMPPVPPNVTLVSGLFEDTLPSFAKEHQDTPLALVHIDCDIYTSTVSIFKHLRSQFVSGTVIIFDELYGYKGWEINEYKAFNEFLEETGFKVEFIATHYADTQVGLKIYKDT